jgi:dCTP deaminase
MILSAKLLSREIAKGNDGDETGIAVVPAPDIVKLASSGEAAVNLRLGRWFLTLRQSTETHLKTMPGSFTNENKFSKKYFVPFGDPFILHPNRFVLASTLEWIRLPVSCAAFVVGKSTLGRRGIIIETAAGVHPGFSGCLTLEIANVGEVPVELVAGMLICQLFFHSLAGELSASQTSLAGQRKPRLGQLREDPVLTKLLASKR